MNLTEPPIPNGKFVVVDVCRECNQNYKVYELCPKDIANFENPLAADLIYSADPYLYYLLIHKRGEAKLYSKLSTSAGSNILVQEDIFSFVPLFLRPCVIGDSVTSVYYVVRNIDDCKCWAER